MPPKKSPFESLKDHLSKQIPWADAARRVRPDTFNVFRAWTGIKLYCVHYYIHVYSTIIRDWLRALRKDAMVYVDILAGSGLNKIRPVGAYLPGSTLLAARVPTKPFDFILALENDPDRSSALKLRLAEILTSEQFKVISYDADLSQNAVLRELEARNAHYLAFVDYESVSGFSWKGLERLLAMGGDVLITLLPGIVRQLGRGLDADVKKVASIIGEDLANEVSTEEELVRGYSRNIRRHRKMVLEVPIRSETGYHYHLIFAARETRGRSPWWNAVEQLQKNVTELTDRDVVRALDQIGGRQQTLS